MENNLTNDINEMNDLRESLDIAWENLIDKKGLYLFNKASKTEVEEARNTYKELYNKYWKKLREVAKLKRF